MSIGEGEGEISEKAVIIEDVGNLLSYSTTNATSPLLLIKSSSCKNPVVGTSHAQMLEPWWFFLCSGHEL